jgi:hypothetical protein
MEQMQCLQDLLKENPSFWFTSLACKFISVTSLTSLSMLKREAIKELVLLVGRQDELCSPITSATA